MDIKKTINELSGIKEITAIYLFGSHARGETKPLSDVDICVITKTDTPEDRIEDILAHSSKKIDLQLFWRLPPAIRYRVLKEGKALYVRDEHRLHEIKVKATKAYLDFKPILDKHVKQTLLC
jgi:hypothetical protein